MTNQEEMDFHSWLFLCCDLESESVKWPPVELSESKVMASCGWCGVFFGGVLRVGLGGVTGKILEKISGGACVFFCWL